MCKGLRAWLQGEGSVADIFASHLWHKQWNKSSKKWKRNHPLPWSPDFTAFESLYDLEALSPYLFFPVVMMSKEESHEQITDIQLVFSAFLAFISLLLPSLSWVARFLGLSIHFSFSFTETFYYPQKNISGMKRTWRVIEVEQKNALFMGLIWKYIFYFSNTANNILLPSIRIQTFNLQIFCAEIKMCYSHCVTGGNSFHRPLWIFHLRTWKVSQVEEGDIVNSLMSERG